MVSDITWVQHVVDRARTYWFPLHDCICLSCSPGFLPCQQISRKTSKLSVTLIYSVVKGSIHVQIICPVMELKKTDDLICREIRKFVPREVNIKW
jgi:hypothetical protein